jgi:molecular chaperone GrpE
MSEDVKDLRNDQVNEQQNPKDRQDYASGKQQAEQNGAVGEGTPSERVGETSPTPADDAAYAETADGRAEQYEGDDDGVDEASLSVLRAELERAHAETADFNNRFVRARADLENYRRRAAQDAARAREAGLDSAIITVLSVYDDLGRALSVPSDDPSQLIPGLQAVREGLKRNLESLGISEIGSKGELFNPDLHEALTAIATEDQTAANTIAEVVQTGFVKEERLVRPARVVVFQG